MKNKAEKKQLPQVNLVGWTRYGDGGCPYFKNAEEHATSEEYEAMRGATVAYMKRHGLKFCGNTHQESGKLTVPCFDNGMMLKMSCRGWGALMADVEGLPQTDPLRYAAWAWDRGGENIKSMTVFPDSKDDVEYSAYFYKIKTPETDIGVARECMEKDGAPAKKKRGRK